MNDYKLLKELTELPGISGNEKQVSEYVKKVIMPLVDEVKTDNIGSLAGIKNGNGPRVLIGGHLDEVGLLVTGVTKDGFIKFQTIGGWLPQVMLAQEWEVHTKKGVYTGVTGVKPPHMVPIEKRKEAFPIESMYVDVGISSDKEAFDLGIIPGVMITPKTKFQTLANPKYLLAKAFDNRIGTAVVIECLKQLNNTPNTLIASFTVMEEVGLRGAKTIANLTAPNLAIAIDTGVGDDTPSGNKEEQTLGKGPQIVLFDASMIPHYGFRNYVKEIAKKNNIPYQESYVARGGTDAGAYHLTNSGVPSVAICIPTRYMHSHTSIIHLDDYLNTIKLVVALVKSLDEEAYQQILNEY